jgi:hypothetical protein
MNGETGINVGQAVITVQEFTYKRVTTAAGTEKDISGNRCILRGIIVNTTNSQVITVYDGTTAVFTIPIGMPLGPWPYFDIGFKTSMKMTYASTGTADITFVFKPF